MTKTSNDDTKLIPSLFLFHVGTNAGYAISSCERLFFRVGLELARGDSNHVHFGYPKLEKEYEKFLPKGFANLVQFDYRDTRARNIEHFADYVNRNDIRLVIIFDIQPHHPLFRRLRKLGPSTTWKLALKRLEMAISRSKVDSLIFESEAMAYLATHGRGVPARMIDVVPLGVDTTIFRPSDSSYVHEVLKIPTNLKVIVYSGHMERRKGVSVLIKSAIELLTERKRRDVCFLLCGNVGIQSAEYERMYSGLGINEFVRFGGYRLDLPRIYPGCFCGVIPSTGWDSFTFTSLEMASSGLPVVVSRLQGLKEAVLDNETGLLFEPGNSTALADCIEMLLDHPKLAAEYGMQGRIRCEREFTVQLQEQRLLAVLRKRLNQGSVSTFHDSHRIKQRA
jgi:glycosyltransferase involved in cell wall biosynthesis